LLVSAKQVFLSSACQRWSVAVLVLVLAGCASEPPKDMGKSVPKPLPSATQKPPLKATPRPTPLTGPELVGSLLPSSVQDKSGWTADIVAAFDALNIAPTKGNVCAVLAEIEQESAFQSIPVVPGLSKIVRGELEARRKSYGIPQWIMDKSLAMRSPNGQTYSKRIDALRTENDVNDLYEDMISEVPMGKKLFADYNPVRTGGPMQVNASFANSYAAKRRYPFAYDGSLRNALFSRKGGLYFGVAYLLDYSASYESMSFRFADYHAGRYSSRNAAFQKTVSSLSGIPLEADGDLLSYEDGVAQEDDSRTLEALLAIAPRLNMNRAGIFRNLLLEKSYAFEQSELYTRVCALAPAMPRAQVPEIVVKGPKFTRRLTTASYVKRVDSRYRNCLKK
jgi:hypothetical protein